MKLFKKKNHKSKTFLNVFDDFLIRSTIIINWAVKISSADADLFASIISDKVGQCRWSVKVDAN